MRRVLAALGRYSKGKTARALLAAGLMLSAVPACTSSTPAVSGGDYAVPAAYGAQVGPYFDCYFIDDPFEVTDPVTGLIAKGLCPHNAIAVAMPLTWKEQYWAYYSSPAYYNVYMPVSYRSHYTSVTVITFSRTYKTQITQAEANARYKTASGSIVTGTSRVKFNSGSTVTSGRGGGSARTVLRPCAEKMEIVHMGSGRGGGSARSGNSSSSTSKSPSNTTRGKTGTC